MRGCLRHRKMLKVSSHRAIVIADNGVLWVDREEFSDAITKKV